MIDSYTILVTSFAFPIGAVIGSFLNVVIYRLPLILERAWTLNAKDYLREIGCYAECRELKEDPAHLSLMLPASSCTHCHQKIKVHHNIPLLSFVVLRGKCAYCKNNVSLIYPLVELACALIFAFIVYKYDLTIEALSIIILCSYLVILAVVDYQRQKLFDILTMPLLWIGLLVNSQGILTDLNSAVMGAVVGYLPLWVVNYIYSMFRKKQAIGHGDFKLLAAIGAWLGWQVLPTIVFLASVLGLMSFLVSNRKTLDGKIAFGTMLAAATLVQILFLPNGFLY